MKKINFTKMVAAGNDFIVMDSRRTPHVLRYTSLSKKICDRKYGVGADGLLVLEKSKVADVKMRIFNADGSEAQMCGNGARCIASHAARRTSHVTIETKAGIIESEVEGENVKIKLTNPKDIRLDIPLRVNNRMIKVNFINTGVPHAVIFVEGIDKIDVEDLGRRIRFHKDFAPRGTNVDFVEALSNKLIAVRTYERGVEDETLACGTGSVASAIIYAKRYTLNAEISVRTKSAEILKVYFERLGDRFKNVWLEGKAKKTYEGVICRQND